MQSGELFVTGNDHVNIPLRAFPSKVTAHFKDTLDEVPCNPHHSDSLEYEVHASNTNHGKYLLKINWRVSGIREVVWHAYF